MVTMTTAEFHALTEEMLIARMGRAYCVGVAAKGRSIIELQGPVTEAEQRYELVAKALRAGTLTVE